MISRQAAIDALAKFVPYAICDESTESYTNGLTDAYNLILHLPSAQPEKRTEERTETHACDLIDREAAVDAIYHHLPSVSRTRARTMLHEVPSAQPVTAKRIVGKSRDGMTLWYQCDMCNEPVDVQDSFCRGCGRRLIDERSD